MTQHKHLVPIKGDLSFYLALGAWIAYVGSLLLPAINMVSIGPSPSDIMGLLVIIGSIVFLHAFPVIGAFVLFVNALIVWSLVLLTRDKPTSAWRPLLLSLSVIFMGYAGTKPELFARFEVQYFMVGHYALIVAIIFCALSLLRQQTRHLKKL